MIVQHLPERIIILEIALSKLARRDYASINKNGPTNTKRMLPLSPLPGRFACFPRCA